MMVDEGVFFREATLRICGSLEIEKALWSCLIYLRGHMPADKILLNVYDPQLGTSELLARADAGGGELVSLKATLSPPSRHFLQAFNDRKRHIVVVDRIGEHPILNQFNSIAANPDTSYMIIGLKPEWNLLGRVYVGNNAGMKYSASHVRLLSLLDESFAIAFGNYIRYRELLRQKDLLADDNSYLQKELRRQAMDEIVGGNRGLKHVMRMVSQVAPLSNPVLIQGETGTGKGVIATAIHTLSPRRDGPFIKVNCGALSGSVMESELFGREEEEFPGVTSCHRGRLERAHGGTVFLDEIGELTPGAQVRLLRFLQGKEIERVGGTKAIPLNVRVIAATRRDLSKLVAEGRFREDLYYRLNVFPIAIPSLRERRGDIPALIHHFMYKKSREIGLSGRPAVAPAAVDALLQYSWPGNIRELQNAVERALILSRGGLLTFEDFAGVTEWTAPVVQIPEPTGECGLDAFVTRHIAKALAYTGGRVEGENGAAKMLSVHPATLRAKMRKLGIPFGKNQSH